jgi:hypothetical protein
VEISRFPPAFLLRRYSESLLSGVTGSKADPINDKVGHR